MNPLESRALPGSLWEKIPQSWIIYEEEIREYLSSHINLQEKPWSILRELSESLWGICLFASLLIAYCLWIKRHELRCLSTKKIALGALLLLLSMASSDLISNAFKRLIGRLKYHVTFYNPNVLPALSMPSNHAFNIAFLWALLFYIFPHPLNRRENLFFGLLSVLVFLIGISRVLFLQHYPSDVLLGWFLGYLGGTLAALICRRVLTHVP